MGWSFSYVDIGRKAHIENLTSASHFSPGYTPVEHRVVGNNVWQLVRIEATGQLIITLDLIAKEKGGGWGYKGLSEDMGPVEVNCPLSLLNKASPVTEGYAVEWREKVRRHHAEKKARPTLKQGDVVKFGEHEYRLLHQQLNTRKGWEAERVSDGRRFRMPCAYLARSTLVATASA